MTNLEIVQDARRVLYRHSPGEPFNGAELSMLSAALGIARIVLSNHTIVTNAERIRVMSDEDLAAWLIYSICKYVQCKDRCPVVSGEGPKAEICKTNILHWLQQPAKEADDGK